jgi:tetratricopeptide (TPR) repeat protein
MIQPRHHRERPVMTDSRRALFSILAVFVVAGCGPGAVAAPPGLPSAAPVASSPVAPSPVAPRPAPSSGPSSPTVAQIARLERTLAANPEDAAAQLELGLALIQRVRETADPSLYAAAEAALAAARRLGPDDPVGLVGIATLHLARHEFAAALDAARQAVRLSPRLASAHAVVVDALVELGRYDEADEAAGLMLAARTDLTTLSRVSYVRELHGDLDAALAAMRLAADAPGSAPENTAYVEALLGNLLAWTGDGPGAEAAYGRALDQVPDHPPSLAGLGRLAIADGDLATAERQFEKAAAVVPLPEYVIALGEIREARGDDAAAADQYELAAAEIALFAAAGVAVDLELALFEADHGDPERALRFARTAYDTAPTVQAADAVAWALHRLGRDDEARELSDEALRLGSRDPLLRFHAGAIEAALGSDEDARSNLTMALTTDAGFSATGAAEAIRLLAALSP